ncbi:MAG TPA: hypothetical protein VGR26_10800 [Acidimicrobiales bacterium]|nr:hypothetical protein [Acidimicrobiales bacterium]
MNLKRMAKTAVAVGPLVLGMASPASACLLTGASETAAKNSPQVNQGPMGIGPTAPVDGLTRADEKSPRDLCMEGAEDGMTMCDPSGQFSDGHEHPRHRD